VRGEVLQFHGPDHFLTQLSLATPAGFGVERHPEGILTGSGGKETTNKAGSRYRLIVASETVTAKRFRTASDKSPSLSICDMSQTDGMLHDD